MAYVFPAVDQMDGKTNVVPTFRPSPINFPTPNTPIAEKYQPKNLFKSAGSSNHMIKKYKPERMMAAMIGNMIASDGERPSIEVSGSSSSTIVLLSGCSRSVLASFLADDGRRREAWAPIYMGNRAEITNTAYSL
jgi:hypothetical protein